MAIFHLSNGKRLNLSPNSYLTLSESTVPDQPIHPINPVIPPNITPFSYQELKTIAISLIQQFGVSVEIHTYNKTVNSDTPWDRTNKEIVYPGYAVKVDTSESEYDRMISEDRKEIKAKFLIGTENLVRLDDWFIFTDAKYTVKELNRLDPGGVILAFEAYCV